MKPMKRLAIYLILIWGVFFSSCVQAQDVYTIGCWSFEKDGRIPLEFEKLITEAYARSGACVEFSYLPMLRDLEYANKGKTDGSWVRSRQAVEGYSNLIVVPTPLLKDATSAFSFDEDSAILIPEDLEGLRIAVVRGDISATRLAGSHSSQVYQVDSHEQLFAVLAKGRVDIVLCNSFVGNRMLARGELRGCVASDPLRFNYLYHVINAGHKEKLLNKLDTAFQEMFRDGTMKRLAGRYSMLLAD